MRHLRISLKNIKERAGWPEHRESYTHNSLRFYTNLNHKNLNMTRYKILLDLFISGNIQHAFF